MKNFIAKDGVSDADLIRAARAMYEALVSIDSGLDRLVYLDIVSPEYVAEIRSVIAKARGEI